MFQVEPVFAAQEPVCLQLVFEIKRLIQFAISHDPVVESVGVLVQ